MKKKKTTNDKKTKRKGNGIGLTSWKQLRFFGKMWRVMWIGVLSLFMVSLLQVLLGWFIDPPLTPLMVQRFNQQLFEKDRSVNFERDYVSIDDISGNLVTAVIAAEDGLYMYHRGFDVKQMKQAYRGIQNGRRFRGGSTISQQCAKNAFLPHSRTMLRKAVEAYYTVLIEAVWGKKRIMEVYLNIVEFGDGIYGCEAASQHYFHHSAKRLSKNEAAQLAATLPAPLKRNPAHQTSFYRGQVGAIKSRFSWGNVNLDMSKEKRSDKYKDQETLWDFFVWKMKQDKENRTKL